MPKNVELPSEEKAKLLLDAAEDRKAVDPVLLDVRGKTVLGDFFLICTGTSDVHIRAIAESVQEKAEEARLARPKVAGQSVGEWILIDFADVVVHVMSAEARDRYRLEQFWTTPQPKGALPPVPGSFSDEDDEDSVEDEELDDIEDIDEDEFDAEAFFADADTEVEPVDEDEIDDAPEEGKAGSGGHH